MLPIDVQCRDVFRLMQAGDDLLLVDCREPKEHAVARIEGAVLMPMSELPDRIAELAPAADRRIVVHCHLGGRSLKAAAWLRQNGYANAQSMAGGIEAWSAEIDPSVPKY